ncbi:uncharacterized protein LOC133187995 [Saccostrea echinata]|uniref:uncharacterized protein LOC133187995 n=1 Tax=Saccostrea echinata TaxID=191078 RepID=UPI002A83E9EF|nr:uncharacterized protein LOC133187995 [Saccostrea echinata]
MARMDLPINKGTGNIQGYNIATLFAKDIKTKLKEILELEEGDKRCYEPHWRHLRWIDRNDLTDHNVMNNSVKGMEERNKLFHKEVFGLFSPPGHYLSLKNCNNGKLMATLEDEYDIFLFILVEENGEAYCVMTGQRLNEGIRYFKDVLLVEARIIIASVVKNITYREAEELLYPLK